jgi:hypothetical protein
MSRWVGQRGSALQRERAQVWATTRQLALRAKMHRDQFEVSFIISEAYLMNLIHFYANFLCNFIQR